MHHDPGPYVAGDGPVVTVSQQLENMRRVAHALEVAGLPVVLNSNGTIADLRVDAPMDAVIEAVAEELSTMGVYRPEVLYTRPLVLRWHQERIAGPDFDVRVVVAAT